MFEPHSPVSSLLRPIAIDCIHSHSSQISTGRITSSQSPLIHVADFENRAVEALITQIKTHVMDSFEKHGLDDSAFGDKGLAGLRTFDAFRECSKIQSFVFYRDSASVPAP